MEPTTYTYSRIVGWLSVIFFGGVIVFCLYLPLSGPGSWVIIIPIAVAAVALTYGVVRVLLPAIRGKVAIELDKEKVQSYITNTTLYWTDIFDILEYSSGSNYTAVLIEMKDGSGPFKIPTKTIAGSTKSICNKMKDYLAQAS